MNKWVLCRDNSTGEFFIILGEDIAAKIEFSSIIEMFNNAFLAYSAREKLMEGVKSE
ncbi:hypothetical protein [Ruminococcus flavefaciens]|uniref:hypothetical protein n=1 Tax=Ruminococcus flavefaciens TaxID=1265 RepID=UPI0026F02FAA|nr:hypothetical protein [Ruminococcus flavefaciens]